jgi:hypothetical protein
MKHGFAVAACLALACLAPPAQADQYSLFFDYVGFDYENPNPDPLTFGELGSGYVGVGFVPNLFAPLTADQANYEYTYVVSGLTPVSITPLGTYLVVDYSPGTLSVYEDAKVGGTAAAYGVNPPNGTAPSSFSDGTMIISGTITNFQFVFNTANGSGSYESNFTVDGGSQLGNVPVDVRDGWQFSGATGNALNIPEGYEHQIDGQTFLGKPTPVRIGSWGSLKARYR